jgi:hypothetical protein
MLETRTRRVARRRRPPKPRRSARAMEVQNACAGRAERVCATRRRRARMPCASPPCAAHLLVRCAIRYCVRFHTFLYSRKLIVIRAGSTEPHASVKRARTPRILRGFSPHRVADVDIITGCCERIARRGGPPRLLAAPHIGALLVALRRASLQPLQGCDRARHSRRDRVVSVTARAIRASCPRRIRTCTQGARLGSQARCRRSGKEIAVCHAGRRTAELLRGECASPLHHGRHHVGWRRIDVTDSP